MILSNTSKLTLALPIALHALYRNVERHALHACSAAMDLGRIGDAMDRLEAALNARLAFLQPLPGDSHRPNLRWLDPVYLAAAALAGRDDLIKLAVSAEELALAHLRDDRFTPRQQPWMDDRGFRAELERHQALLSQSLSAHEQRRLEQLRILDDVEAFTAIREAAAKTPGLPQVSLTGLLPDHDSKAVALMVNQLEAAGQVTTTKDGARVLVWPAGHAGIPAGAVRKVKNPWTFTGQATAKRIEEAERQASEQLEQAQGLIRLFTGILENPGSPESVNMLHLVGMGLNVDDAEGNLVRVDTDPLEMIIWGHIDTGQAVRILETVIDKNPHDVTPRQAQMWLKHGPRTTYLKPVEHTTAGYTTTILRECAEGGDGAFPVTVLEAARRVTEEEAARGGSVVWLSRAALKA